MARIPLNPPHPERVCWGCDAYCPAESLGCAGGTIRTPHPVELFGEDWLEFFDQSPDLNRPPDAERPRRS